MRGPATSGEGDPGTLSLAQTRCACRCIPECGTHHHTHSHPSPPHLSLLPQVAFNDDCPNRSDSTSCLSYAASANQVYAVQIDSYSCGSTSKAGFVSLTIQ